MSLTIRKFELTDYPVLELWFKDWGWDSWKPEMLSPYSYLVEHEGKPVLFTSFYKYEGVLGGNMGFTISDRKVSKYIIGKAICLGLDHIFKECEKLGLKALQYATDRQSKVMVDFFVKKGATLTDSDALIAIKGFDYNTDFYLEGK